MQCAVDLPLSTRPEQMGRPVLATAHLCGLVPNADYVLWGDGAGADTLAWLHSADGTAAGGAFSHIIDCSYLIAAGTD
jgi:hypothetical protein